MNLTEVATLLTDAGFQISKVEDDCLFGTIQPEHYGVGKNHFHALFRDVFLGDAVGGYYVTSSIIGDYRKYRGRRTEKASFANIFGHGKTPLEAVSNFLTNFKQKRYNVGK